MSQTTVSSKRAAWKQVSSAHLTLICGIALAVAALVAALPLLRQPHPASGQATHSAPSGESLPSRKTVHIFYLVDSQDKADEVLRSFWQDQVENADPYPVRVRAVVINPAEAGQSSFSLTFDLLRPGESAEISDLRSHQPAN